VELVLLRGFGLGVLYCIVDGHLSQPLALKCCRSIFPKLLVEPKGRPGVGGMGVGVGLGGGSLFGWLKE